ncbi:hypothetical protein GKQ23_13820 [Erwinia sp. E602]|uniref:hypothetical protein n=1 Tax=unclassified Erwinia TaxID=2622719 RepID=UPI0006F6C80F|nr:MULTISPECIES: hypothetical protein [unclassified Erwinia]KQN53165.1 hypothetical protein ASF13_16325 [Erwinia sp. Leaf53]QUG76009.1 hypothetical protein GKQ23_13820 [Erwinia sp. E602]
MSKKVIAFLPHDKVEVFFVEENLNYLTINIGGENGSISSMGMPIEKYTLGEKYHYIALCHSNIPTENIEKELIKH